MLLGQNWFICQGLTLLIWWFSIQPHHQRGDTHHKVPELEEGSCHVGEVSEVVFMVNCPFGEQQILEWEHSEMEGWAGLPGAGLPGGDVLTLLEETATTRFHVSPWIPGSMGSGVGQRICISSRLWSGGCSSRTIPSEEEKYLKTECLNTQEWWSKNNISAQEDKTLDRWCFNFVIH